MLLDAGEHARADAEAQLVAVLAAAVANGAHCQLSAAEVSPVCEVVVVVRRLAAANGIYVPEPPLARVIEVCEDLATRNRRIGYAAMIPIGPLASCLYDHYKPSGRDFGYSSENQYLRDLQEALPAEHWQRLANLQNPDGELAAARLDALRAADINYHS
jgi:hypothetical protein